MPDFGAYLSPRSVAVIGASDDDTILRGRLMRVITGQPYKGRIYPISRRTDMIMGLKTWPSVADTPEPADLAILIIPAEYVVGALEECAAAGVKAAHIITSGFAEEPGETGARHQARIREIAEAHDMVICGPNSQGFMNAGINLTATFSPAARHFSGDLLPASARGGRVSVVAQSGGLGFSFFDHGRPKGIPFHHVVTTGNEAAVEHLDIVEHLIDSDAADVFLIFMEDVKTPAKLFRVGEKALRAGKPIITCKVGRSDAGQRAAASHTAALAGAHSGYRAVFDRYGIIESDELDEMVDIAMGFSRWGDLLPAGRRIGITTSSGGAGGLMADAVSEARLLVPELDEPTQDVIKAHLPSYGYAHNPVDATAQAVRQLGYFRLNAMVAASDEIDAIVSITSARDGRLVVDSREDLIRLREEFDKPVIFYSYTEPAPEAVDTFAEAGVPLIWNARHCAVTLAAMATYRETRERFLRAPQVTTGLSSDAIAQVGAALAEAGPVLTECEAGPVLAAGGLPWAGGRLARSAEEAGGIAAEMSGSVALKIQSPDILHKTEAGGVVLGVDGGQAVREAARNMLHSVAARFPTASVQGVLVQPMAGRGVEMVLGVRRDPQFGPMLMAGLGGVLIEVLKDAVYAPAPVTVDEAERMLGRLKGRAILDGVRGQPAADVSALVQVMTTLSELAAELGDGIEELDLNPVIVHPAGQGVTIADALLIRREASEPVPAPVQP